MSGCSLAVHSTVNEMADASIVGHLLLLCCLLWLCGGMDVNVYCLGKCQPYSISDLGQVTGYFTVLFMQLLALSAQSQLSLCLCHSLSLSPSPPLSLSVSLSVVTKCITGRIERLVIMNEWVPTIAYKEVTY